MSEADKWKEVIDVLDGAILRFEAKNPAVAEFLKKKKPLFQREWEAAKQKECAA